MKNLNVRLLRQGRDIETAFTPLFATGGDKALSEVAWDGIEGGRFFFGQIYSNPPGWLDFVEANVPALPAELYAAGAGAVLFVPVEGRFVAICFGHIHIALNDDAFQRQFGLRVTLNSVPRDGLRTLDLATPDAVTFQKRVQASKDSDLQQFGVNPLRDLARVAGGTPRDPSFARFVAGKDSLSITCGVGADQLQAKSSAIMKAYLLTEYKKEFAWVDNMQVVSEKDVVAALDAELGKAVAELRAGNASDLHMAPPEVVDYTEGSELHYNGFGSHGTNFTSLSINDYVSELNRCGFAGDFQEIKSTHRVAAKGADGAEFTEKWRVYDCFVFESTLGTGADQRYYVLFAGDWYLVQKQFKASVDAYFASLERVALIGPTLCSNERKLIADLQANRPDLLMLDQVKINPAGVRYANLEPCDFLTLNGEFIHLKDGNSSGSISHLWSQGVVSAEALVSDADFRKKLRAKVKAAGGGFEAQLPKATEKVVRENYKVVYGIMRKPYANGDLDIPFFSKVSLQAAAERISQFGLSIAIELIQKP